MEGATNVVAGETMRHPDTGVAVAAREHVLARRLELALAQAGFRPQASADDADVVVAQASEAGRLDADTRARSLVIEIVGRDGPRQIRAALARGARGVVREPEIERCLGPAVRAVLSGQLVLPADAEALLGRPALSAREKQVLSLVVLGLTNPAIAAKLHVAESTVKSHLTSSFRKLGVRTRSEATARILEPGGGLGLGILSLTDDGEAA
jgi:DNA-binding NarL/FixJ family response regulator